jgi:hypothetical protein
MRDGYQRNMKGVFIAREASHATVMGVLLTPAHPLKCITLITVHLAPVTQMVKQTVQLFRKKYTKDVMIMQQLTYVVDFINPM